MTGLNKILAAAVREYRVTALTWAFLLAAVVFPIFLWTAIILFTTFGSAVIGEREPISGTVAVYDTTEGDAAAVGIGNAFDPAVSRQRQLTQLEEVRERAAGSPLVDAMGGPEQLDAAMDMLRARLENASLPEVSVESLEDGTDLEDIQRRVREGEFLALVVVDERSISLPVGRLVDNAQREADSAAPEDDEAAAEDTTQDGPADEAAEAEASTATADPEDRGLGEYEVYHSVNLDTTYLDQIRGAVHRAIQDERYRRMGIPADEVLLVANGAPRARTTVITAGGEETDSADGLTQAMPFLLLGLLFAAVMTGGQYLMMGTMEEKQSRVMEVLLSAVSPWQLLVGKMAGQAAVGLTVMVIYGAVGVFAADHFGVLSLIPTDILPLVLVYFLMAYLFLGAMMVAVGSAVTEIREAQALYPPITFSLLLPMVLLFVIMQNPASIVAVIFSYFPPTTPFVMVMRLSQPAYPVPMWEVALSLVVGFAGVLGMIMLAARIFRVGVLSYGKAPSLLGILKWARQTA